MLLPALTPTASAQTAPEAPTNVRAAAHNGSVTLAWTASPGATHYRIYRRIGTSEAPVTGLITVADPARVGYTNGGLTNDTFYTYWIKAYASGLYSAKSNEVSAVPSADFAAPAGLTATNTGFGQVELSWAASVYASHYNIYVSSNGGTSYSWIRSTNAPDTSLSIPVPNGATFYYVVRAQTDVGTETGNSNQASVTTQALLAPQNLTATPSNGQIKLTWTPVRGATQYRIYRKLNLDPNGAPIRGPIVVPDPAVTGYTDTTVIAGEAYFYFVRGYNPGGYGPPSADTALATGADASPLAPTGFTATPGNGQISLKWNPSVGAARYAVYHATRSNAYSGPPLVTLTRNASTAYTHTGLDNGSTHFYIVRALNADFQSAPSNEVGALPSGANPPLGALWRAADLAVANDGTRRVLWVHPDGAITLWSVDAADNVQSSDAFGPYDGWSAKAISVGADGKSRVLWSNTNGEATLWTVNNASGIIENNRYLGLQAGWTPRDIATGSDNKTRILWNHSSGATWLWVIRADDYHENTFYWDPIAEWNCGKITMGADGRARLLWRRSNGEATYWTVNSSGGIDSNRSLGLQAGWTPKDIATGSDNKTRILWNNDNNSTSLWIIRPDGTQENTFSWNAIANWTPVAADASTGGNTATHILWNNINGQASIWTVDAAGGVQSSSAYGPFAAPTSMPTATTLTNLTLSPATVFGGSGVTGTVTLSDAAPTGGATVNLSSNNSTVASVPATVMVAATQSSATFTINAGAVSTSTPVTITAAYGGITKTATLTVNPAPAATLTNLTLSPTTAVSGAVVTGALTLNNPAPAGGVTVNLSSSNNAVAPVPATVIVPATQSSKTFTFNTGSVSTSTAVTITAVYAGVTKTATLTVNPAPTSATLTNLTLSPATVVGGTSATGTVTLSGPAPAGGVTVNLSKTGDTNNVTTLPSPATVVVAAGQTSKTFTITTRAPSAAVTVTVSAVYAGVTKQSILTVNPPSSLPFQITNINNGSALSGYITVEIAVNDATIPPTGIVLSVDGVTQDSAIPSLDGTNLRRATIHTERFSNAPHTVQVSDSAGHSDSRTVTFSNSVANLDFERIFDTSGGDGLLTSARITATVAAGIGWTVSIKNDSDVVVKTFTGVGPTIDCVWNGGNNSSPSVIQPDGIYQLFVTTGSSNSPMIFKPVALPHVEKSIKKDGSSVQIAFSVPQGRGWHLRIQNQSGDTVRTFSGKGTSVNIIWDGKNDQGVQIPNGQYHAIVTFTLPSSRGQSSSKGSDITVRDFISADPLGLIQKSKIVDTLIVLDAAGFMEAGGIKQAIDYSKFIRTCISARVGTTFDLPAYPIIIDGTLSGTKGQKVVDRINGSLMRPLKLVYFYAHGNCVFGSTPFTEMGGRTWYPTYDPLQDEFPENHFNVRDMVAPFNYGGASGDPDSPGLDPPKLVWIHSCRSGGGDQTVLGEPNDPPPYPVFAPDAEYSTGEDDSSWADCFGIDAANGYEGVALTISGYGDTYHPGNSWSRWQDDIWRRLILNGQGFGSAFAAAEYGTVDTTGPTTAPLDRWRWRGTGSTFFP